MNELRKTTPKPLFLRAFSVFLVVFRHLFNFDWKVEQKSNKFKFLEHFCFFWHPSWPHGCPTRGGTVCFRLIYTPISEESKSLFLRNNSKYDNMQYIIEKPYKMVTKNAKKNSNFSTFVRFLGPFLKKQRFWKMGNFETDENFWVKLSANLPH